jgi:protein-S-isoprenylcysteine O-methyltransferase Ste14
LTISLIEKIIRLVTGLAGLAVLLVLLAGIARGLRQPPGRTSGRIGRLRSPAFYFIISLLYFGFCALIWRPLGLQLDRTTRIVFLATGATIFCTGLGLILWGRLTLGQYYFGSTTHGAQLFEHHRLVTTGAFSCIRHPMYLGYLLAGLGGILLFQTWTMVFFSLHFPALMRRARQEERVLEAEFGDEWREYCQRVPAWLPLPCKRRLHPGLAALLETALLFLPAIPAYLFYWPHASANLSQAGEIASYVYFAVGTLLIGRRWSIDRLGLNRQGIWLGLICGFLLVLARTLVILGVMPAYNPPSLLFGDLIAQTAFYLGLVGLVEELLFRGMIYRAVEDWLGARWAIWISSLAFGLWHIFGQGPAVGAATFFYGLIFALMRRRAGGIIGLIFAHGWMDLATFLFLSPQSLESLTTGRPEIAHPMWVFIGMLLLVQVPVYLWKIHPLWAEKLPRADVSDQPDSPRSISG